MIDIFESVLSEIAVKFGLIRKMSVTDETKKNIVSVNCSVGGNQSGMSALSKGVLDSKSGLIATLAL